CRPRQFAPGPGSVPLASAAKLPAGQWAQVRGPKPQGQGQRSFLDRREPHPRSKRQAPDPPAAGVGRPSRRGGAAHRPAVADRAAVLGNPGITPRGAGLALLAGSPPSDPAVLPGVLSDPSPALPSAQEAFWGTKVGTHFWEFTQFDYRHF